MQRNVISSALALHPQAFCAPRECTARAYQPTSHDRKVEPPSYSDTETFKQAFTEPAEDLAVTQCCTPCLSLSPFLPLTLHGLPLLLRSTDIAWL